jgi:hypothetical protein
MLTLPQATVLGPLEHAVMGIVWAHAAPITVRHVYAALGADCNLAYTTVMTTMMRLTEKGMLTHAPGRRGAPVGAGWRITIPSPPRAPSCCVRRSSSS